MRESLKSKMPIYSPSKEVWQELESRLDEPTFQDYKLPIHEAPDQVWEKMERNQENGRQSARKYIWLKIAAGVVLLFTIPLVIKLLSDEPDSIRHTIILAQANQVPFAENEASVYSVLSEFHKTQNTGDTDVSDLLEELKVLEQDKKLMIDQMQNDDSPQIGQMLMEIELDMAVLVREISNKLR